MNNNTSFDANEYDSKINITLPYYSEYITQSLDLIDNMDFEKLNWLDLGCGTGNLEIKALDRFSNIDFTLVEPDDNMLDALKSKLSMKNIKIYKTTSNLISFKEEFNVVTAILSHHYMKEDERKKATDNIYNALVDGGIYISFENIIPEDDSLLKFEQKRWENFQVKNGKTKEEAKAHISRCGVNFFPITVNKHIDLLKNAGFRHVNVFWRSFMQMGIYGIK